MISTLSDKVKSWNLPFHRAASTKKRKKLWPWNLPQGFKVWRPQRCQTDAAMVLQWIWLQTFSNLEHINGGVNKLERESGSPWMSSCWYVVEILSSTNSAKLLSVVLIELDSTEWGSKYPTSCLSSFLRSYVFSYFMYLVSSLFRKRRKLWRWLSACSAR